MLEKLASVFRPRRDGRAGAVFKDRYTSFKAILDANSELLRMLSSVERALEGRTLFGMAYVRSQATRCLFYAARMVQAFEKLTGRAQPGLRRSLEDIRASVGTLLENTVHHPPTAEPVLPHTRIGRDMLDSVGGKNANLGEMAGALGLPVPRGFALTTAAYQMFLEYNDLADEIDKAQRAVDPESPESLVQASEAIQALFLRAGMPPDLEAALKRAAAEVFGPEGEGNGDLRLALRSSAIGEDSELSFAGQYKSVLGVPPSRLAESYQLVLASLFTPRAMSYRLSKGVPSEDTAMSVACLEMVDSRASGVAYSRDPLDPAAGTMVVNAVWGLGPYAVDGRVDPDVYRLTREDPPRLVSSETPVKEAMLVIRPGGGVEERPVDPADRERACLSVERIEELGRALLRLEEHFGSPQDVEWAVDQDGRLLFLQARPLRLESGSALLPDLPEIEAEPVLEGATVACSGAGAGPVHLVRDEDDLLTFPNGGVLVAEHSSPAFSLVMPRAAAVVAEHGSVTGHMASLAREYRLPALMGAAKATKLLVQGREVTVDAYSGRVYPGRVEALLSAAATEPRGLMEGTPVFAALRGLADFLVPLNLTDPKSPQFRPQSCRTVHDIMRYVHEKCYAAMFDISDLASERGNIACKLQANLPLDLHVIDIGGGLDESTGGSRRVGMEQVRSAPFRALLRGMLDERLTSMEPRPVDVGGFFSVMARQMLSPDHGERFGEKSYAIISDKYLNFSSRVGYHYGVLDAYCGATVNSNYINFRSRAGRPTTCGATRAGHRPHARRARLPGGGGGGHGHGPLRQVRGHPDRDPAGRAGQASHLHPPDGHAHEGRGQRGPPVQGVPGRRFPAYRPVRGRKRLILPPPRRPASGALLLVPGRLGLPLQVVGLLGQPDHLQEPGGPAGLEQVVHRAQVEQVHRVVHRGVAREHHHLGVVVHVPHLLQGAHAGQAGHLDVQQDHVEAGGLQDLKGLFAGMGRPGRHAVLLQNLDHVGREALLVVHYQNPCLFAHDRVLR